MPNSNSISTRAEILQHALSIWDNEGGALASKADAPSLDTHEMTNVQLVHLRIRVIALESLILAVLAEGSDRQLEAAREVAKHIAPRSGFTQHPLTLEAAAHINDLIDRADKFRAVQE